MWAEKFFLRQILQSEIIAIMYCNNNDDTVDSVLTDTSVKRTLRVGPCLSLLPLFDSL